jgi:multiple sugar transport system substrate-binding protein
MPGKPQTTFFFLLIVLALFGSSCSTSPTATSANPVTRTPTQALKTATITTTVTQSPISLNPESLKGVHILVAHAYVGVSEIEFSNQLAKFNTVNSWGITVYPQPADAFSSLFDTVNTNMSGADQPDLVITLPEQILTWEPETKIIDLASYQNDPQYGFSQEDNLDFEPFFQPLIGEDATILALPATVSSQFLYYNQTWARQLGFTHPPLTSTEFREQACAANQSSRADADPQNDGYGGWLVNTNPQAILAWMQAFGGGVEKDGKYSFSSKANETTLQFLKKLYDDHCAFLSMELTPYDSFAKRSALFITASLVEAPYQTLAFQQASNTDEWTVLPFPGSQNRLIAEGSYYSILESNPTRQLATWLFIRWLLSSENQVNWVKSTGMLPLRVSSEKSLASYAGNHKQWQAAISYMDDLQLQPQLASWRNVRLVLGDGSLSIFRTNLGLDQVPAVLKQMDIVALELSKALP